MHDLVPDPTDPWLRPAQTFPTLLEEMIERISLMATRKRSKRTGISFGVAIMQSTSS